MRGKGTAAAMLVVVALVLVGAGAGCSSETPPSVARGEVVSVTPTSELSKEQTAEDLDKRGLSAPVHNGVDLVRIEYTTVDPRGGEIMASGLLALPQTESLQLRTVSFAHGTIVRRDEAPSTGNTSSRSRALMFAASGYAVAAPDYLGLGTGEGRHPYAHAPSEASASLDLLRAARTVADQRGRELDQRVLVSGFSQGGQAATALAQQLGTGRADDFELAAVAGVSGPYDLRNVQAPAGLDGRVAPISATLFFAYWLTSANRIYDLYDDPAEAFQQPYAGRVENLFDGSHDIFSVGTSLPTNPQKLLTPRFIDWTRNPDGAAAKALADSDNTCQWKPEVPVRLYAGSGDTTVPYANSEHCLRDFGPQNAELIDLGDVSHSSSAAKGLPQVLDWFHELAPPSA